MGLICVAMDAAAVEEPSDRAGGPRGRLSNAVREALANFAIFGSIALRW